VGLDDLFGRMREVDGLLLVQATLASGQHEQ
jgi:hypothetical protein